MIYYHKIYFSKTFANSIYVVEYKRDRMFRHWDLKFLKLNVNQVSFLKDKKDTDSFFRSQKWIKQNHPELLI
jgi:hypothetical protein